MGGRSAANDPEKMVRLLMPPMTDTSVVEAGDDPVRSIPIRFREIASLWGRVPHDPTNAKEHETYLQEVISEMKTNNDPHLQDESVSKMLLNAFANTNNREAVSEPVCLLCNHFRVREEFFNQIHNKNWRERHQQFALRKHPLYANVDLQIVEFSLVVPELIKLWCNSYMLREQFMGFRPFYELNVFMEYLLSGSKEKTYMYNIYWVCVNVMICEAHDANPGAYSNSGMYNEGYHPFTTGEWNTLRRLFGAGLHVLVPYSSWFEASYDLKQISTSCKGVGLKGPTRNRVTNLFAREVSEEWDVRVKNANGKRNWRRYVSLPNLLWRMLRGQLESGCELKHSSRNRCRTSSAKTCLDLECYIVEQKQKQKHIGPRKGRKIIS